MRKLLFIPIVHSESDLGSVAPSISRTSASLWGEKYWARHKAAVSAFWQTMADYLGHVEATNLKIYQDGLVAGGELGRRIVEEAARRGSKNYEIVLNLMKRGAEIRATEDASLLREEYEQISRLAQAGPPAPGTKAYAEYASNKDRLTDKRDRFVAETIDSTLRQGEVGLLFMGAYHDVVSLLAGDILVTELKERKKVKAYFEELASGRREGKFEQLAEYLGSSIGPPG